MPGLNSSPSGAGAHVSFRPVHLPALPLELAVRQHRHPPSLSKHIYLVLSRWLQQPDPAFAIKNLPYMSAEA